MNHLLYEIIELGINVLESVLITWFISSYLGNKYEGRRLIGGYIFGVVTLFLALTISNYYIVYDGLYLLIYIVVILIYSCIFLQGSLMQKAFICAFSFMLTSVIATSTTALVSMISGKTVLDLMGNPSLTRYICVALTKIIYFAVAAVVLTIRRKNNLTEYRSGWIFTGVIGVISIVVITFIINIVTDNNAADINLIHVFLAIAGVIVVNIISYYQFVKINRLTQEKYQFSMLQREAEYYKNHLHSIKSLYDDIRTTRHDMKNHLVCISALIQEEKYSEALSYIDRMKDMKVLKAKNYIETSNDTINCLLNTKLTYCDEHEIEIKHFISGDLNLFDSLDLTVLLSNVLDNAIEACEKCEKPQLQIIISDQKNYLSILVSNSITYSVLETNPELKTTKKDKGFHGLGTVSIRNIVDKYQGMLNYSEKDGLFTCSILLNKSAAALTNSSISSDENIA